MKKIKLPSMAAAAITGAVTIPVFALGLEKYKSAGLVPLFLWYVFLSVPCILSTIDLSSLRANFSLLKFSEKNLSTFYVPTLNRIIVWYLSGCISAMSLGELLSLGN